MADINLCLKQRHFQAKITVRKFCTRYIFCKLGQNQTRGSPVGFLARVWPDGLSICRVQLWKRHLVSQWSPLRWLGTIFSYKYRPNMLIVIMTGELLELHCSRDQTEQTGPKTETTDDALSKFIAQGKIWISPRPNHIQTDWSLTTR